MDPISNLTLFMKLKVSVNTIIASLLIKCGYSAFVLTDNLGTARDLGLYNAGYMQPQLPVLFAAIIEKRHV